MREWSAADAARLRSAVRAAGLQEEISERSGIPISTLRRILKGDTAPGEERLRAICAAAGVTVSAITESETSVVESDVVMIPVNDIEVAAGSGRVPLGDDSRVGSWPFPRDWITSNMPGRTALRIVRVAGDSQLPELRDGDAVMIDLDQTRLRDGMHVVRLDDALLIKRVQVQGSTIRLKSANPAYEDIVVPYPTSKDDMRLAIVGRAVWAGKLL